MAKGWFRRKKAKLVYCWYNANSTGRGVCDFGTDPRSAGSRAGDRGGGDRDPNRRSPRSDVDWKKLRINIRRDWVDGELGRPKSMASKAPVEMHETLADMLAGVASGDSIQQGLGQWTRPGGRQRMLRHSRVDMTMHYVHNGRKATNAQAQFIERFLPNGDTLTDVEEGRDGEREPVRVQ